MSFESEGEKNVRRVERQIAELYDRRTKYTDSQLSELQEAFEEAEEALDEATLEVHDDPKYQTLTQEIKLAEGELKRLKDFLKVKGPM